MSLEPFTRPDSYSRILRRGAVTLSTTPGHANAVPALANAIHSEAPVINISGSADSPNLGRGAMQEFDQVGVAAPVTKGAWQVPSPERIPEYVALAFRTALAGRQGPVHLTIPHDFQSTEVDESAAERYAPREHSVPRKGDGRFSTGQAGGGAASERKATHNHGGLICRCNG